MHKRCGWGGVGWGVVFVHSHTHQKKRHHVGLNKSLFNKSALNIIMSCTMYWCKECEWVWYILTKPTNSHRLCASFKLTFAISFSVRSVFWSACSSRIANSLGERIAGTKNRRKIKPVTAIKGIS